MESEYQALKAQWLAGDRERETGLRLMFFAWMHWADPSFVTGLADDPDAIPLWCEIFDHLGGEASTDVEFLFVASVMAQVASWVWREQQRAWEECGARMLDRALSAQPTHLPLCAFDNRGEYGAYFAHQLRGHLERP